MISGSIFARVGVDTGRFTAESFVFRMVMSVPNWGRGRPLQSHLFVMCSPTSIGGVFLFFRFWLLDFLASWLLGFLASWLLGFLASWLLGFSASWLIGFWACGLFSFLLVYVAFGGFLAFRILCIPSSSSAGGVLAFAAFRWFMRLLAAFGGFGFSHPSGFLAFAPFHWFWDLASRIISITTTLFEISLLRTSWGGTPCVAFASHVDPGTSSTILVQGPSCMIRYAVLILQPLQKESSRAPCRNNTDHRTRDIHSQFLHYWHIGLSCRIDPGRRDPYTMSSDGEGFMEAYSSVGRSSSYTEETVAFTTIEASKRGPLLKSRLIGMYKAVLNSYLLQDPDEGVNYFKNTLKKFFLKGSTNVYLYRLLSFFNHRRQNTEFLIFTSI